MRALAAAAPRPRDFQAAVSGKGVALIAECKQQSPSAGRLQERYDPVELARRYVRGGAAAVSVLTEPEFFGGSFDHLQAVREAVDVPLLCKDFLVEPYQVWQAKAMGADAVLLIVASGASLEALASAARREGLTVIVEVHSEDEVETALTIDGAIIGINNRDLTRMQTTRDTTARLRPLIPDGRVVISESGIENRQDVEAMRRLGVNAILVGEALLKAEDLDAKVRELSGR